MIQKQFRFTKLFYYILAIVVVVAIISFAVSNPIKKDKLSNSKPVRIGYFHGGRVNMIYRAYINNYFDKEGVRVELYTRNLNKRKFFKVNKSHSETKILHKRMRKEEDVHFGKVKGTVIVEKIISGELVGGTVGESSFVLSIEKKLPIVAVAMLGYDAAPGKAILMRKDVKISSTNDFKGKTLISRRAGPGDAIFLREFIEDIGIQEKDLKIIDNVDEDVAKKWLKEKRIDGGLFHLVTARKRIIKDHAAYVYRPMNWMNSKISHALLIFHKNYLRTHKREVQKIVNAYVKRIAYEKELPPEKKDKSWDKGLMMEGKFQGMKIPHYDLPPKVRLDLLLSSAPPFFVT